MNGLLHHLAITLKLNFRSKQAIIYGYVVPIFFLFALGSVFASKPPLRADMGRLLTITILGGACFGMPTTMVAERERGVWRRYRLAPTGTGGIILSSMVARFFILLSAALMQILLARCIYKTQFPDHPLGMFIAFCFVCFAFLGLGLIIAMVSDNVPAVQALGQAIFLPLIIIGGVGVNYAALPKWAQHVANFLPGRYAVDALQSCQAGNGLEPARLNLLALTVIGMAAILAGSKLFRWDVAQKISRPAQAWVAIAIVAWVLVGCGTEYPNWKFILEPKSQVQTPSPQTRPSAIAVIPSTVVAPATPKLPWELLTKAQIDSISYDDLPDDASTTTPFAHDLNGMDDDSRKRLTNFKDALGDWPPGQVADVPQRIRNFLSICAVADVAEDQNESQIPFVVFDYLRGSIQHDELIKAMTWVILNDKDGAVLTNLKDFKDLSIDAEIGEEDVRTRSTIYAKKMLYRLLGKMPPENK